MSSALQRMIRNPLALVVIERTTVGGDVHAANLAIVPKLARAAFLDECAPLVLEQALPRSLADVRVNAVLALDAFVTRGVRLRQRPPLPLLERARGRRFIGL